MLTKKENEKILADLEAVIKSELKNGFKNRNGKVVDKVDYVNILNCEIDEENEDRNKVIILKVNAVARVYVIFSKEAKSSDNISLRNAKPIEFFYDEDINNFRLSEQPVEFFDTTI